MICVVTDIKLINVFKSIDKNETWQQTRNPTSLVERSRISYINIKKSVANCLRLEHYKSFGP